MVRTAHPTGGGRGSEEIQRLVDARAAVAKPPGGLLELKPLLQLSLATLFAAASQLVLESFHLLALVEPAKHLLHARSHAHAGRLAEAAEEARHLAGVLLVPRLLELARHRLHGA